MGPLVQVLRLVDGEKKPPMAGHFLNAELFYDNPRIELDLEVIKGWFECITRLVPSIAVQEKILEEQALYKAGYGLFGSTFAKSQRKKLSPSKINPPMHY
ncbi:hypothetical protein S245_003003 [Arachis hypogaea]